MKIAKVSVQTGLFLGARIIVVLVDVSAQLLVPVFGLGAVKDPADDDRAPVPDLGAAGLRDRPVLDCAEVDLGHHRQATVAGGPYRLDLAQHCIAYRGKSRPRIREFSKVALGRGDEWLWIKGHKLSFHFDDIGPSGLFPPNLIHSMDVSGPGVINFAIAGCRKGAK